MFRVGDTILSEEIATARFACDITRCKGACCVVGESGAPVAKDEIPALRRAARELRTEMREESIEAIDEHGLIQEDDWGGHEITCASDGACVFVEYDENGVAGCLIQRAFQEGRFNWEKPVSCHLYPIRLRKIAGMEYANFEYIPSLCGAGCDRGEEQGIYLSQFLERALVRRYGQVWYDEFEEMCQAVRERGRA